MHEDKSLGDALTGPGSLSAEPPAIPIAGLPPTECWGYDKSKQIKEPVLWNAKAMRAQFAAGRQQGLHEAMAMFERAAQPTAEDAEADKALASDLMASIEPAMADVAQAVAKRCAEIASAYVSLMSADSDPEDEADGIAAAILAEFGIDGARQEKSNG